MASTVKGLVDNSMIVYHYQHVYLVKIVYTFFSIIFFRIRKLNFAKMRLQNEGSKHPQKRTDNSVQRRSAMLEQNSTPRSPNKKKEYDYNHPEWVTSNLSITRLTISDKPETSLPEADNSGRDTILSFNIDLDKDDQEQTEGGIIVMGTVNNKNPSSVLHNTYKHITNTNNTSTESELITTTSKQSHSVNSRSRHLMAWDDQLFH